jgi:hypothetical protein
MTMIPTIKVVRAGETDPVIINTSDFDAKAMRAWSEPVLEPEVKAVTPPARHVRPAKGSRPRG